MMIGLVMPKMQPAVQTLLFVTTPEATGTNIIDLSQSVSIANRRGYRQGLHWSVASIKIISGTSGSIQVHKINENWITTSAWNKSFKLWDAMNKQVLDKNPGMKPKFYDFKVGFDSNHNFAQNLLPLGADLNAATPGEWVQSTIQLPNDPTSGTTTEYPLHMLGADGSGKGCIRGYIQSRPLISNPEPDLPSGYDDNWMVQLMDSGENFEEIAQDLASDNDDTPYPVGLYPGAGSQLLGEIHDLSTITSTTVGGLTYIKGGSFPCGLIKFVHEFDNVANYTIQIDLVPGKTRGYLAEPMTKM